MTLHSTEAPLVSADDITGIAQDVWSSFLSMDLEPHPLGVEAPALDGRTMTGTVHVSGEWQGSVFLQVPDDLGQACAEAMVVAAPGPGRCRTPPLRRRGWRACSGPGAET
jgi:hypothetical protein